MQIDQRTHLTHRKLMIALQAHFAAQMPFNKLTVKQLCHDAHVGRATFYRHHQDIADIIVVEYLITLQELGHALNNLENPTYATIAGPLSPPCAHTWICPNWPLGRIVLTGFFH
ncbi:uncharacterized protein SN13T_2011 [Lactiplantibacillus plantarum]|nr:uncharacterized protein SN13T_2011 [Lactiplantibacillus plantarum]